jgi:DNA-binding MarR family transcriptional regulator
LVKIVIDKEDRRSRRLTLTVAGRALLAKAVPIWKAEHAALDKELTGFRLDDLRAALRAIPQNGGGMQ